MPQWGPNQSDGTLRKVLVRVIVFSNSPSPVEIGKGEGPRRMPQNVVEVEANVPYTAALAKVDTSIVFESFSLWYSRVRPTGSSNA
ncbi:hypothetical protein HDU67_001148 [Dinochytrium kinnereticum]|nr:hypothetical protein HDU67_001148 [Dinochytrium kinnereticum]